MTRAPHPLWDPIACLQLRRLLRRRPCDILHLHSAKAGWLGRLAAWDLDCQVVYSPHAFPFLQRAAAPLPWIYKLAERLAAKRTDILMAVGSAEGRLAVECGLFDPDRVRVLPNAVDAFDLENEVLEIQLRIPSQKVRTIGLIGELRRQKDPFTFLRAVRQLSERNVPVRFVMPAYGPYLKAVVRYIHCYRLDRNVELLPAQTSLAHVYRRMDVGVLPSLWEGLPYSLLEALALKRPVIASSIPPLEEILRRLDPELLFSPGNSKELARRLEAWALAPPERLTSVGEKGRNYVLEHHNLDDWRASLREFYRSLVSDSIAGAA